MQLNDFSIFYSELCFAFDKEIKEGQMKVYYKYLSSWEKESMGYAVDKAILHNTFFPKISELITLAKEYREIIPPERQLQESPEPGVPMPDEVRNMIRKLNNHVSM